MKKSALIIAHNEEKHIAQCITSVLNQTQKADEVVVVCHNCSDGTEDIVRMYAAVKLVSYNGPHGITYARIEGLKHVSGEIILCTDGDSYVAKNWVREMCRILAKGHVLVGSWVKFEGTLFGWFANFWNKYRSVQRKNVARMIWGPSMAFWGRDKSVVNSIFEKTFSLSKELGLKRNPDDYWLARFMEQRGRLGMTNKTFVIQHTKETSSVEAFDRSTDNVSDGEKIDRYFHR